MTDAELYSPTQIAAGLCDGERLVMCSMRLFRNVPHPLPERAPVCGVLLDDDDDDEPSAGPSVEGGLKTASISAVEKTGDERSYMR